MNTKKSKETRPAKKRSSAKPARKPRSTKNNDDFNTGIHSPSTLRNVGPGYDDTGMGDSSRATRDVNKTSQPVHRYSQRTRKRHRVH